MEARETRLIGVAHCIVPKEEIAEAGSAALFIAPSMPILPTLLKSQVPLPNLPTSIVQQSPSIVQVILPATIMLQPPSTDATPQTVPALIDTLSTSSEVPSADMPYIESSSTTTTSTTTTTTTTVPPPIHIPETWPPTTLAPIDTITTVNSANLDTDNSVYEKLSQIPQVLIANSDRGQHFAEPEEPPETLQDQFVSGGP